MKAVQLIDYLDKDVLKISHVKAPVIGGNDILVKVLSASINPFDIAIANGNYRDMIPLQFPFIPGGDFAGEIEKVSSDVTGFKVGDEVYGSANVLSGGSGAFSEHAVVTQDQIAVKPKKASFEEAAAMVQAGVSAYQAIYENIVLQNEQKILIHGGAGGVGHLAIQMAKALGAHIATTVSMGDFNFVKQQGATGIIDYKTQEFEKLLKEYDAVFDTVGGDVTARSLNVLKKGGVLTSMSGDLDVNLCVEKGIKFVKQKTKVTTERLQKLAELVDQDKVKVNIDRMFYLPDIKKAFEYARSGSPRGKVVVKISI